MEALSELNEAVKKVIDVANDVNDEVNAEVWSKAPLIIHQRLCSELVKVTKEQPKKKPSEVPKAVEVLTAIGVLGELYPELNKI